MVDPVFPVELASEQDSSKFQVEQEDNAVKGETEGGYVFTRRRNTRRPRRTFTTGFTDISQALQEKLETFYDLVGTHTPFVYTNPATGKTFRVRFTAGPKYQYTGMGKTRLWSVASLTLKET